MIFMHFGRFGKVKISRPTVLEIVGLGLVLIFASMLFAWWHWPTCGNALHPPPPIPTLPTRSRPFHCNLPSLFSHLYAHIVTSSNRTPKKSYPKIAASLPLLAVSL